MKELGEIEGEEMRVLQEMKGSPTKPEVNNQLSPRQQEDLRVLIHRFIDS